MGRPAVLALAVGLGLAITGVTGPPPLQAVVPDSEKSREFRVWESAFRVQMPHLWATGSAACPEPYLGLRGDLARPQAPWQRRTVHQETVRAGRGEAGLLVTRGASVSLFP